MEARSKAKRSKGARPATTAILAVLGSGILGCRHKPEPEACTRPSAAFDARWDAALERETSLVHIQILAINDFHGNLEPPGGSSGFVEAAPGDPAIRALADAASPDARAERVELAAGGAAYLATHVKRLGAENPNTLVVSAGDLTGASPLLSNLFKDEPTILVMNHIGLDLEAVGNHDFDRGLQELRRLASGGCSLGDCDADAGRFPGASFQYLAANVRTKEGETVFAPYALRDVAGVRLAFIGVTLEATPTVTVPSAVHGLRFENEARTVNALVPELAAQRVDDTVVLIHQGAHQRGGTYDSCEDLSGDLMTFLGSLNADVKVVVSAHTHQAYDCVLGGRLVTSAGSYGRLITRIDLTFDRHLRRVTDRRAQNIVVTRDVPPDPEVAGLIEEYRTRALPVMSRVVGYVKGNFTREDVVAEPGSGGRRCETPVGELIADAQLAATRAPNDGGAQVAFMNPGGIRMDLFSRSGETASYALTFADAFEVQPFGNRLITMTLRGDQIQKLLDTQSRVGRFLQVSSGFSYRVLPTGRSASSSVTSRTPSVALGSIRIGGEPLAATRKYRVTVNSFLAAGGDQFEVLLEGADRKEGPLDIDALTAYLGKVSSIGKPLEPPNALKRIGGGPCK
jgi:5'-nucleotidase